MTNIKDILSTKNKDDLSNYTELDDSILEGWSINYTIIKQSQFLIYISEENNYIDLIQLRKKYSSQAKRILINHPENSEVFNQMNDDLQVVDGHIINKEIAHLTKEQRLIVDTDQSNLSNLVLTVLRKDESEDEVNESNG